MVVITVEAYQNSRVHTMTVKNKELFWVKMIDIQFGLNIKNIQFGLNIKNIPDLARKEICGIFETKDLTEEQRKKYMKSEYQITKKPTDNKRYKYGRSDIIGKIIKNCRGVKKCNDGINRIEKENQGDNFRILLGFKENEVYESKEGSITKKSKENISR